MPDETFRVEDYIIPDDDPFHGATCDNGCPEGYQGKHKFSCMWSGHWYADGREVKVTGESQVGTYLVCVTFTDDGSHEHVERGKLTTIRYGEISVQLTRTDGNTMSLMSKVAGALRKNGHADRVDDLTRDVFDAQSADDALQRMMRWVVCR